MVSDGHYKLYNWIAIIYITLSFKLLTDYCLKRLYRVVVMRLFYVAACMLVTFK